MGKYTTLDEEVKHFKKMALITEDAVKTKPPCGCNKPEDGKEIVTSEHPSFISKKLQETVGANSTKARVEQFVAKIDKARFFRRIGGVTQIPTENGVIYSPIEGDSMIYFIVGEEIDRNPEFSEWYDKFPQSKKDEINEVIINELAQAFKLEW